MTNTTGSARAIVLALIEALNKEAFDTARQYVADNMIFKGVLGTRESAEAYFEDMRKMKLKYDILQSFEEGDDVCLLYNLELGEAKVFCAAWYRLEKGKIVSLNVVFDPRPVLEKQS